MNGDKEAKECALSLLFCAVLFLWSLVFVMPMLPAADTWWHLASGKYLYTEGISFLGVDPFSFGTDRGLWLNHEWLSEIIFFLIASKGISHLFLFRSFVILGAYIGIPLILAWIRRKNMVIALVGAFICLISSQGAYFFDVRSYIFTYILLSHTLLLLYLFKADIGTRYAWSIPPIVSIWACLHGGYIVGILVVSVVAFAFSFEVMTRRKSLILAGISALSLGLVYGISPYGYSILLWPFSLMNLNAFSVGLNEWNRPSLAQSAHLFILFFVLTWGWRKFDRADKLLGISFLFFGMLAWRHAPLVSLMVCFLWISAIPERSNHHWKIKNCLSKTWIVVLFIFLSCALFMGMFKLVQRLSVGYRAWSMELVAFPYEVCQFIGANEGLPQKIFVPYEWGGFLEYKLYPQILCFYDGRANTLFSEKRYAEGQFIQFGQAWLDLLKKNGLDYLLADKKELGAILDSYDIDMVLSHDRLGNLAQRMEKLSDWKLIYRDGMSSLFVRSEFYNSELIASLRYPVKISDRRRELLDYLNKGDMEKVLGIGELCAKLDGSNASDYLWAGYSSLVLKNDGKFLNNMGHFILLDPISPIGWEYMRQWARNRDWKVIALLFESIRDIMCRAEKAIGT